jgi:hypothetical protein
MIFITKELQGWWSVKSLILLSLSLKVVFVKELGEFGLREPHEGTQCVCRNALSQQNQDSGLQGIGMQKPLYFKANVFI